MPLKSPIFQFPEIMDQLKKEGYTLEIPVAKIRSAIMLVTGEFTDKRIKLIMARMEELGYIRQHDVPGFFVNLKTLNERKLLAKDPEKEADSLLNDFPVVDDTAI